MHVFAEACERQYRQTFTMMRQALELCPEELWADSEDNEPPFWQQAFHALVVTGAYASEGPDGFRPEIAVRVLAPREPKQGEPPWHPIGEVLRGLMSAKYRPPEVLSRAEMLEYLAEVEQSCRDSIARDAERDPVDPASNPFPWTGTTAFDKHIYNLRHLHHHLGRLNGLLRRRADVANPWVTGTR